MLGWIVQKYSIVPASEGVNENEAPCASVPESSSPPDFAVTVCGAASSLVQVIFWPTFASTVSGPNAKPSIASEVEGGAFGFGFGFGFAAVARASGVTLAAGVEAAAAGVRSSSPPQAASPSAEPASS